MLPWPREEKGEHEPRGDDSATAHAKRVGAAFRRGGLTLRYETRALPGVASRCCEPAPRRSIGASLRPEEPADHLAGLQ